MSFFKHTFEKVKKSVEKGIKEAKKVVDQGVDELEKGANLAKEGLEEAGDFLLNSSDREYWNKEISHLKNRLNRLREELGNKMNTYYEVRIDYQHKIYQYITIRQDTIALRLLSSQELDKVTDTAGNIVDTTRDFSESNSEIEEIGRYALGFVSAGISDIIFASQEAEKEGQHLHKQISRLEDSIEKINSNIVRHKKGIVEINQSVQEILLLYGDDTTVKNFVQKQCEFIYKQAQARKLREIAIRVELKEGDH